MESIHISLAGHPVFHLWGVPITDTIIFTWMALAVLIGLGFLVGSRAKMIPGRLQSLFEVAFQIIFDYMAETLESKKLAMRFFPLITTLFLFIFSINILGFFPGVESVGFYHDGELSPLLRHANTDLNTTLALAIIVFLVIEISGIVALGFLKYWGKFITFKSPIALAVGLLELIGNLARLVSFSFRLFGNIFAGHVLIVVIAFFVPFVLPVPLMLFEVFVALLQAAIFALLTLVFIKLAISEPHGEEAH